MNNCHLLRSGLLVVMVILSAVLLHAQQQVLRIENRDTTIARGKIPAKQLEMLFNTAEATLKLYNDRASMIDVATQNVSGRSTAAFRDLFVPNSSVYNDVGKDTSSISASNYATQAFTDLRSTGIKFKLQEPRFERVDYDSAGYYRVGIRVIKLIYLVIGDKGAPVAFPHDCPRRVSLLLRFEINKNQLLVAKIIDIQGRELPKDKNCLPAAPNPVIGLGPGVFMTKSNPQFQSRLGSGQMLKTELNQAWYFGLHYLRPLSPKKPFLVGVALGYSSQALSTQTDTVLASINVKNNTKLLIQEFKEEGKVSGLEFALGLGYQKKLKDPISIGMMFWGVGTLPANNKATQSYKLNYRTSNALKQPFKQLADTLSGVFNQSQFRLGVRFSPYINCMFGPQIGLQLECNYHLMLNNVYPLVAEDEDFFDQYEALREQNNKVGALGTSFEAVKFNSLGFRLALIYTISK